MRDKETSLCSCSDETSVPLVIGRWALLALMTSRFVMVLRFHQRQYKWAEYIATYLVKVHNWSGGPSILERLSFHLV